MYEIVKFLVDESETNGLGKLIQVEGWLMAGYKLNENHCLYISSEQLILTRNLHKSDLDIYYTTSSVLLGKTPNDIKDEREYINKFLQKLMFTPLLDWLLSESFENHLEDISEDFWLTDGVE
ncbi:hypothetical protein ACTXGU_00020 [Niallia sp. 01092]|uniref:hypothetical protein n=1 Tax=Niallia sp. 01092 TaxID=3457759 RepID=UPI003FCFAB5B